MAEQASKANTEERAKAGKQRAAWSRSGQGWGKTRPLALDPHRPLPGVTFFSKASNRFRHFLSRQSYDVKLQIAGRRREKNWRKT
jgi:hypothetical protein